MELLLFTMKAKLTHSFSSGRSSSGDPWGTCAAPCNRWPSARFWQGDTAATVSKSWGDGCDGLACTEDKPS
ncbi:hypothetical protein RRG08_046445 [Elysia crispata]|uniref:Uncharacterized protein n=1 Tax=Elysia crispata TaxID=231223 RepID=A0AAE0YIW3_9GAST|nr:hypothetical protein RRG08_046445 [Elysia crispata]